MGILKAMWWTATAPIAAASVLYDVGKKVRQQSADERSR